MHDTCFGSVIIIFNRENRSIGKFLVLIGLVESVEVRDEAVKVNHCQRIAFKCECVLRSIKNVADRLISVLDCLDSDLIAIFILTEDKCRVDGGKFGHQRDEVAIIVHLLNHCYILLVNLDVSNIKKFSPKMKLNENFLKGCVFMLFV